MNSTEETKLFTAEQLLEAEANAFITTTGILTLLKPFGELVLEGSYVYHTMVDRDIDVRVIVPDSGPTATMRNKVIQEILQIPGVRKLRMSDLLNDATTENFKDPGIWIGPQIMHNGQLWNVDIWLFDTINGRKQLDVTAYMSKLSDKDRAIILNIKTFCLQKGLKKKGHTSVDIYQAVIAEGITSSEEYITKRGLALL